MRTLRILILGVLINSAMVFTTTAWAFQVTIGFDDVSPGTNGAFLGHTEDGFDIAPINNPNANLSVGSPTSPSFVFDPPEIHRTINTSGGGALSIVTEPAGSAFTFVALDIAEFDSINQSNFMIQVAGFFGTDAGGNLIKVAEDFFTPPGASGLSEFMTVAANNLAGIPLDELRIVLPGDSNSYARIDNIVLDNMAVPAPPAMLLMMSGLFSFVGWRKWMA